MIRHVVLDRDGVLNRELAQGWLADPAQWRWEDGALDGLRGLAASGVVVSVVTNQSGIGRGAVSASAVDAVHRHLLTELDALGVAVVGVFVCPHAPADGCDCRKPSPGLVDAAVAASGVPREATLLVGDATRDLEAGRAAGVPVALVATGKGAATAADHPDVACYAGLHEVAVALGAGVPS